MSQVVPWYLWVLTGLPQTWALTLTGRKTHGSSLATPAYLLSNDTESVWSLIPLAHPSQSLVIGASFLMLHPTPFRPPLFLGHCTTLETQGVLLQPVTWSLHSADPFPWLFQSCHLLFLQTHSSPLLTSLSAPFLYSHPPLNPPLSNLLPAPPLPAVPSPAVPLP